jgi:hypothetical protein
LGVADRIDKGINRDLGPLLLFAGAEISQTYPRYRGDNKSHHNHFDQREALLGSV